jgi:GTP-binding protein
MSSTLACSRLLSSTLTPFLYPCLDSSWSAATSRLAPRFRLAGNRHSTRRWQTTTTTENAEPSRDVTQYDHLNPQPSDYSETPFTDACTLTVAAGNGGHGCISFLREKYVPDGPPIGGDGGTGGSIYIQAVRGETSLHKLARRGTIKADRGRNGQGTSKGGKRGEDILLTVPVGTVIREVSRNDPIAEDEAERKRIRKLASASEEAALESEDPEIAEAEEHRRNHRREKWLLHPAAIPHHFHAEDFPSLPPPRRNVLAMSEPRGPIRLDLNKPMEVPMLLAAGAVGGLGNTHFVTTSRPKPKFATKGDSGIRISLQLELKLLADVDLSVCPTQARALYCVHLPVVAPVLATGLSPLLLPTSELSFSTTSVDVWRTLSTIRVASFARISPSPTSQV